MNEDAYITDEAEGRMWRFMLGDSAERMTEIPDESVDLSVYSPPFQSLYTYSPSPRDMGNSLDRDDFFEQYGYIIRENYRIQKPGTECVVHVQQTSTTKATHGVVGLTDFRGDVIRAYQAAGFVYFGENVVDKDPQAQAIRTKAHSLMFVTKNKDSSLSRMAMADYGLIFKKPGERDRPVKTDVTFDIVDRLIERYSNKGELVYDPFGGLGTVPLRARRLGRRGRSSELNPTSFRDAVMYQRELDNEQQTPTLFDLLDIEEGSAA